MKLSAPFNKLFDERNLRDFHRKHYDMSLAQFKKRTTHMDILGKVYDLYQHVVKTCPNLEFDETETRQITCEWTQSRRI